MSELKFTVTLVRANLAVVHFHVLHEPSPVLQGLLDHTEPDNKGQGSDHADGGEGADRGEREDGGEEEVEVGDAAELLEDGLGEEGEDVILGGGDVVGGVLERLPAVEDGVVAVHDAREARAADGAAADGGGPGGLVGLGLAEAGEGVELAPSQAVALPRTGHLGGLLPCRRAGSGSGYAEARIGVSSRSNLGRIPAGIPTPSGRIRPGREGAARRRVRVAGGGAGGRPPPIPPRDSRAAGGDAGELAWPGLRVEDWRAEREGRRGGTQQGDEVGGD